MTGYQMIYDNDKPLFVLVPYDDFQKLVNAAGELFPPDVVKKHLVEGKTLMKAWREYKGISQREMADMMKCWQSTISSMELNDKKCRRETLGKIAVTLGIKPEQLSYKKLDEYMNKPDLNS